MINKKNIGLFLGPIVFFIVKIFYNPVDLSEQGLSILASTLWVAIWWITEAVPIYVMHIEIFHLRSGH